MYCTTCKAHVLAVEDIIQKILSMISALPWDLFSLVLQRELDQADPNDSFLLFFVRRVFGAEGLLLAYNS